MKFRGRPRLQSSAPARRSGLSRYEMICRAVIGIVTGWEALAMVSELDFGLTGAPHLCFWAGHYRMVQKFGFVKGFVSFEHIIDSYPQALSHNR